jgi:hypothetical protein
LLQNPSHDLCEAKDGLHKVLANQLCFISHCL